MRLPVSILTVTLGFSTIAATQSAGPATDRGEVRQVNVAPTQNTIVGCLAGRPDQYRLTESDGTMHLLIGANNTLGQHVGQTVQLVGYSDMNRDASASSDNGTTHGMRFFLVEDVMPGSGECR